MGVARGCSGVLSGMGVEGSEAISVGRSEATCVGGRKEVEVGSTVMDWVVAVGSGDCGSGVGVGLESQAVRRVDANSKNGMNRRARWAR